MKKLILSTMAILCAGVAFADPVEGVWQTNANDNGGYAYVQIAPCGDKMCGTIIKAFDSDTLKVKVCPSLCKTLSWSKVAG